MSLTLKQSLFVAFYLGEARGNGTAAARMAGYRGSSKTLAQVARENLEKPVIHKEIATTLAAAAMRADEVLGLLGEHARASLEDFLEIDARGRFTFDLEKGRRLGKLHLIKRIDWHKDGSIRSVELYDAQEALALIARHHGLFVQRREITGPNGGPIGIVERINADSMAQARQAAEDFELELSSVEVQ